VTDVFWELYGAFGSVGESSWSVYEYSKPLRVKGKSLKCLRSITILCSHFFDTSTSFTFSSGYLRVYNSLVYVQCEKMRDRHIIKDIGIIIQFDRENHTGIFCLRMEDSKRRITCKNSQDWEWRPREPKSPREKRHLPKGRKDESKNIVDSSNIISETGADGSMTEARIEPGWRINDILLAAKVLQNARPSPNYANEAEMRRVFGLVYDVLRCEI